MMSVQNVPMRITSLRKEAKRDPAAFAPKMHQRADLGANFRGSCNCIILDMATDDVGGVYIFLLKPNIIPDLHLYIMYIGRVMRKKEFSLRKRCREYLKDTRPKIMYMREMWGKDLYFYYLPIRDDKIGRAHV